MWRTRGGKRPCRLVGSERRNRRFPAETSCGCIGNLARAFEQRGRPHIRDDRVAVMGFSARDEKRLDDLTPLAPYFL